MFKCGREMQFLGYREMEAFFFCEIASVLGQEIELLKSHVIICSHVFVGETV